MSSTTDIYASYFSVGMKVGVSIPTHNAEIFRDWAIIYELDDDLVFLQLSRDQLPLDVSLHVGQIIELRGGKGEAGYSCRAIIVSEGVESQILLRLIGEIVTDELREFYRIDAFLPVKYHISEEQKPKKLEKEWNLRREQRIAEELHRKEQRWESKLVSEKPVLSQKRKRNLSDSEIEAVNSDEEQNDPWDSIIPLAANISGGGIRIKTPHSFEVGQYLPIEILVPVPHYIVDAVARVVSVKQNTSSISDRDSYDVSLKFIYIHERDRDAIVNYISNIQLKRIRQFRMQFAYRDNQAEDAEDDLLLVDKYTILKQILFASILFCFLLMIVLYMWGYANNRHKNEIEEIFEKGLKKYLQQTDKYLQQPDK